MKFFKKYKTYLIYNLRWQLGFFFAAPLLYIFIDVCEFSTALSTFLMQLLGAQLYWFIDKWIFKYRKDKD